MRPVDRVLKRLDGVQRSGDSYVARCPCPDHGRGLGDRRPSLSVDESNDGRVLLKCHAGCEFEEIVGALGLKKADLFERQNGSGSGARLPPHTRATAQPCTLESYAAAKRLRVDRLKALGLSDYTHRGQSAVRIPYKGTDGEEIAVRFRLRLDKSQGDRFRWRRGDKPAPYGLWMLEQMREAGHVTLVEGESDCHTLWQRGEPALGVPGASQWKEHWATYLEGFEKVYAVIEPDKGGETMLGKLTGSSIRDRLHLLDMGDHEDASGLYMSNPAAFEENWRRALGAAIRGRSRGGRSRRPGQGKRGRGASAWPASPESSNPSPRRSPGWAWPESRGLRCCSTSSSRAASSTSPSARRSRGLPRRARAT
jgi:hypothetical protein